MDIESPHLDLALQFKTVEAFNTAFTSLNGNAFKFDTYQTIQILRFFTKEAMDNAILHIAAEGIVQDVDYIFTETF